VPCAETLYTRYTAPPVFSVGYGIMLTFIASFTALTVVWVSWFFGPLLVLPAAAILQYYLRSVLGRRVCGATVTPTTVARVGLWARLVTSLLVGGLLVGQVVDARKNHAGPAYRSDAVFATALVLALVATALLVGGSLSCPADLTADILSFTLLQKNRYFATSVPLALTIIAVVLGICAMDFLFLVFFSLFSGTILYIFFIMPCSTGWIRS
jgi:hypothetical protein